MIGKGSLATHKPPRLFYSFGRHGWLLKVKKHFREAPRRQMFHDNEFIVPSSSLHNLVVSFGSVLWETSSKGGYSKDNQLKICFLKSSLIVIKFAFRNRASWERIVASRAWRPPWQADTPRPFVLAGFEAGWLVPGNDGIGNRLRPWQHRQLAWPATGSRVLAVDVSKMPFAGVRASAAPKICRPGLRSR